MPEEEPTPDLTALTDRELYEAYCEAIVDNERQQRRLNDLVSARAQAEDAVRGSQYRLMSCDREIKRRTIERMEGA